MVNIRLENDPKSLYVDLSSLTNGRRYTFLTEDIVANGATLRVQSVAGFESLDTSSGQIVMIGQPGQERTEIFKTSSTIGVSPSYKEITLTGTTVYDHPQDTKVYIIDYNRLQVLWAATVNGTKATVSAYPFPLIVEQPEMRYVDASATAGYFFARFNNSINSTYSDYSDPIPYNGYDDNTVMKIKEDALAELGEEIDETITHDFLNSCLWKARREYHESTGKRPFRRSFNNILGTIDTGMYRFPLPTTVERPWTAENIFGVRIGDNENMRYYDKKEWDFDYIGKAHTVLTADYNTGARDLYVSSAADLDGSGAVTIRQTTIEYSEASKVGGTLRISSDGEWNSPAGADVWQDASYGLPTKFTVWADSGGSAYIYFNRPLDTSYVGMNVYCDYYRTLPGYDSDADVLDEPNYDMYKEYLKARIKQKRAKGNFNLLQDDDYNIWTQRKKESLAQENVSTDINIIPNIPNLPN